MAHSFVASACAGASEQNRRALLEEAVAHAAHLLPTQAPIHVFIHHNTLHAFEHLPFEEAVESAGKRLKTEPYLSESVFAGHLARGRILTRDLEMVLREEDEDDPRPVFPGGPTRASFKLARLQSLFEVPTGAALDWALREGGVLAKVSPVVAATARTAFLASSARAIAAELDREALERAGLEALWRTLCTCAPPAPAPVSGARPRDHLLARTGTDLDEWVHPFLIRFTAAFVDQGVAYWTMPLREQGLFAAFCALYGQGGAVPAAWLAGLPQLLRCYRQDARSAEDVVLEWLDELAVPPAAWAPFLEATLLALPGWAGMLHQLERAPGGAPVKAPPARLIDFLAVRLILDGMAVRHAEADSHGRDEETPTRGPDRALAYEAFVTAQILGLGPAELGSEIVARTWLAEIAAFDHVRRRRLLHLAYERRHRVGVLDGLLNHLRLGVSAPQRPRLQAVFCIDDREESLRRHLEEVDPEIETFGYAGFFGVAMAFRGLEDVHATALCPVVVRPRHLITEHPEDGRAGDGRKPWLARLRHAMAVSSKTALRGSLVSSTVGLLAVVPLIGRCLFPRLWERSTRALAGLLARRPPTRLRLERAADDGPGDHGLLPGYTIDEMTGIVETMCRTIGLTSAFAPIVMVIGHGAATFNNPHASAYDCGACGGGRGGPNARAFALMANRADVRARLRARGIDIPDSTWFVGGVHDTCDDSITCYDEERIPEPHLAAWAETRAAFDEARRRDAHERCRRFESAPTHLSPEQALAHVHGRSLDLGQPRPECGHATNAVCFVGRRELTRGLFLDRRAFLVSYRPEQDPTGERLVNILQAVGPVGAGINLEYYFSHVDNARYGCGTKLPHNVVGLVGVMDGHASDLRTGLPWQMVELHEPVRMLTIIESEPETLLRLLDDMPDVARLVRNRWIQVVAFSPSTGKMSVFGRNGFIPYDIESSALPQRPRSVDHYRGQRDHLPCARIEAGLVRGGRS